MKECVTCIAKRIKENTKLLGMAEPGTTIYEYLQGKIQEDAANLKRITESLANKSVGNYEKPITPLNNG